ncbi:hypothetical protein [Mucilaginibacter flavidus]|uniref:hypothetical protein n=1 Tax=Mucilaginibacter flavidus TaxID=2949309 RepID=UPI002092028E|nr:hypothetical protein [Mucilaginibacter flavidus]MCO5949438.1 hypothetical protein [Mucilaginibacter flavidus]
MRAVILILVFTLCSVFCVAQSPNPKIWTKNYKLRYYKRLISSKDTTLPDDLKVKDCNCIVEKMAVKYPQGLPTKIPDKVMVKVAGDCAKELTNIIPWSSFFEQSLKETFSQNELIKALPTQGRISLCNCYITQLKKSYPNGLPRNLADNDMKHILQKCPMNRYR